MNNNHLPASLVIIGPTASGKTAASEAIAQAVHGEIINADVGQFYTPLTIGTAKPLWKDYPFKSSLFDIVDQPTDINIVHYRTQATTAIINATKQGLEPIIVGGSLFYLKSLFFPPHEFPVKQASKRSLFDDVPDESLWDELYNIDPERALAIHHHDVYRIKRALNIWETTGIKPSAYKPEFKPVIRPFFVVLDLPTHVINQRIDQRTEIMLSHGWIDEVRALLNTPWEQFLSRKQLIGYYEIFEWLKHGEQPATFGELVKTIQRQTRQYAKRQRTFWRGLIQQLEAQKNNFSYDLISFAHQPTLRDIHLLKNDYLKFKDA